MNLLLFRVRWLSKSKISGANSDVGVYNLGFYMGNFGRQNEYLDSWYQS